MPTPTGVVGINLTYQWQHDGTNIPGATFSSYTNSAVTYADAGDYSAVVTSTNFPANPVTNDVATVAVVAPSTLNWDVDSGTTGAQGGDGTWNLTNTNWWNGTATAPWVGLANAVFGAGNATNTVTLADSLTASSLTFNDSNYIINASSGKVLTLASDANGNASIAANSSATIAATLAGSANVIKSGAGTLTLGSFPNSLSGNLLINGGAVVTSPNYLLQPVGALGAITGSRTITVTNGATLTLAGNNIFGGGGYTAATVPSVVIDGATVNSTRYNTIGNVTLNGGTLSQNAYDSGSYQGYELLGSITVGGTSPSFVSMTATNAKADHLLGGGTNVFNVADVTGDASVDLTVSVPLIDGSGDYPGVGTLVKTGAGTMLLSGGVNAYTGTTTVSGGTLAVNGQLTSPAAITLADNTGLSVTANPNSQIIPSAASLTLGSSGTATNTLTFNNLASTSQAPINGGALAVSNTVVVNITGTVVFTGTYPLVSYYSETGTNVFVLGSLPAGVTATLNDDHVSSVSLNVTATPVQTEVWTGTPNGNWAVGGTANWQVNSVASVWASGNIAQFDDTATGTTAISLNATVNPSVVNFNNNSLSYSISGSGAIAGTETLNLNGMGTVALNNTNTYSGGTIINNGTLAIATDASLGSGGLTINSGTLDITGAVPLASAKSIALPGGLATIQVDGTNGVSLAGIISGNGSLTKTGTNTLALSSQSTYTGGTTIDAGVLNLTGGGGASGTIRNSATINAGGTLRLSTGDAVGYGGGATALTYISINGGTLNVNTTANQTLGSAAINMTGGAITGVAGANLDFFGGGSSLTTYASPTTATISGVALSPLRQGSTYFSVGAGTTPSGIDLDISSVLRRSPSGDKAGAVLYKADVGTLRLSAVNTYVGGTEVQAGKLILTGRLTGGGNVTVDDGAELDVYSAGNVPAITINNTNPATLAVGTFNSPVTVGFYDFISTNTPFITTSNLTVNSPATVNIGGYFVALGQYPLIKFTGTNGGAGSFTLGTLPAGVTATLVTNVPNQSIDLNVTAAPLLPALTWTGSASGVWDINTTTNWTTNGVNGVVYQDPDSVSFDDTALTTAVTLTTNVAPLSVTFTNNAKNYTLSGSGAITGSTGLTKNGSGTVTLANTNTYTGETVVNAGTLQLNDAPLSTSDITNSGAVVYNTTTNQSVGYLISGAGTVTKTGAGALTITKAGQAVTGGLIVNGGTLKAFAGGWTSSFYANVSPRTITVNTNGTLETQTHSLGGLGGTFNQPVITLNQGGTWQLDGAQYLNGNNLVLQGATVMIAVNDSLRLQGGTVTVNAAGQSSTILTGTNNGQVTLYGDTTFNVADGAAATDLSVSARISSSGNNGLIKAGAGVMTLTTNEIYTGNTTITGGTLALAGNAGLASTNIIIGGGATLDVTGLTATPLTLTASQSISNSTSTANIQGSVNVTNGALNLTYAAGAPALQIGNGTLTLATNTVVTINNTGAPLANAQFKLISIGAGGAVGGATPSAFTVTGSGLAAGATATLTNISSELYLNVVGGSSVNPNPTNLTFSVSGSTLTLSWPADHLGWSLQYQTNALSAGLSTNWVTLPGSSSVTTTNLTIDPTKPTVFYRMIYTAP